MGADSLRDIYIVTMQARNPQDTVDSSDSFVLYVYKSGALDIVVDGQKTDGLLMDNSQNPAVNRTTTENVEKVREEADLQSTIGINSGDYQWSSVDDQIAWESSDNNAANLNFQQGGSLQRYPGV